jgi:hypothetical protein
VATAAAPPAPAAVATAAIDAAALRALADRLAAVERHMGAGRFSVTDYPAVFALGAAHAALRLSPAERATLDALFALDARRFGFAGPRASASLEATLPVSSLVTTRGSTARVYPPAAALVARLQAAGCARLVVTSGVRGIPKQTLLFVRKVLQGGGTGWDFARAYATAARSVAPPGYSFHATGDIDVGESGAGPEVNFSERFVQTGTYRCIAAQPGVRWRYPPGNEAGVMHEPWHLAVP